MKSDKYHAVSNAKPVLLCGALLLIVGCKSIGPGTVQRDRLHYSAAVADSRKEQLLLNIVRTRYADAPAFLEVASVVAGYSLETGVSLNGQFSPESLRGDTFAAGGVAGTYTDRPTISYSPMTGEKFARSLLAPVPLEALWFVIQGGVPVDFILGLTVQAFEGHLNASLSTGQFQAADPEFTRLLQILRVLQQARVSESDTVKKDERLETWIRVRIRPLDASQTVLSNQLAEVKELLGIPAETNYIKVVFGTLDPDPAVVAIRTRSLMQILSTLGAGVRFPADELANGGVVPVDPSQAPRGFTVQCGKEKPDNAFVAVPYQGHWFWIDRKDLASKMTLATVVVLFNFLEGGEKVSPLLTIPINN
jgi:hypothetical protein